MEILPETVPSRDDIESMLASVVWQAQDDAALVAEFLRRLADQLQTDLTQAFPRSFLLELAAILRIGRWQQCGLPDDLLRRFPPAKDLLRDLMNRFTENPLGFFDGQSPGGQTLAKTVLLTRIHDFSWTAPIELGVDLALSEADEDMLLDAIANLLAYTNCFFGDNA